MSRVSREQIIVGFVLVILTLLLIYLMLGAEEKTDKGKKERHVFRKSHIPTENYLYRFYRMCRDFSLTRRLTHKISSRYEILLPGDKKSIGKKTAESLLIILLFWMIMILTLTIIRPNYYTIISAITILYFATNEIISRKASGVDLKITEQYIKYIGNIRHNYVRNIPIEDAIQDTNLKAPYEMSLHGEKILSILKAKQIDREVAAYGDVAPNKLFKMFLSLCVMTAQKGDKKINGQSLFLANLLNLKAEAHAELIKIERINYLFAGLSFISLFPMFFLELIKRFATENFTDLEVYYTGAYGFIVSVAIFFATISCYTMINRLKDKYYMDTRQHNLLNKISNFKLISEFLENYMNQNYGKTLLLKKMLRTVGSTLTVKQFHTKRILFGIITFLSSIILFLGVHHYDRNQCLNDFNNISMIRTTATEEQQKEIIEAIKHYVQKYKGEIVSKEQIERDLVSEGIVKNQRLMTITIDEVYSRINQYRGEYFKWYELLISFLLTIIAFQVPYYTLNIEKKAKEIYMDEEISQFQSIIIMLMHIENVSAFTILEWMETFSVVFRESIRTCVITYQTSDVKALQTLKKAESYEPFLHIVDNLEMCDRIGAEKAFDEIEVDRKNDHEKRNLDTKIYTSKKAEMAMQLAAIPLMMTIILYLIIPFMVGALYKFTVFNDMMKTL